MDTTGAAPGTTAIRRWRPGHWPTVTLVLLASVLAVLAVLASREPSFGWDRAIASWLLGFSAPAYDAFMEAVSVPGNRLGVWITMLAGAALATWLLGWRAGLLVFIGLGVMGVNEVFKDVVDRPRPLEDPAGGGESFPSGHTMHAVLTSGLLWLLVMPKLTRLTHRRLLLAAMLAWPVLVGVSRVHLERHWPSDVLGAYVFGAALLIVMAWVWPRVQPAAVETTAGERAP
ncbi:MAG: phosphatase PAP2 family protein [Chloroflexi bacterium]|nr:phosphatase PAP2 family protein [Chloroflexota bacterium]